MTHFNDGPRHRFDTGKSATSTMTYNTEDESVDIDDLNEKMQSFPQDILELSANKANLQQFKSVSVRSSNHCCLMHSKKELSVPSIFSMDPIDNLFREKSSRFISAPCIQLSFSAKVDNLLFFILLSCRKPPTSSRNELRSWSI